MKSSDPIRSFPIAVVVFATTLVATAAVAAEAHHGRMTGLVTDRWGKPLVGAEIAIVGPGITRRVEMVLTDANGRFAAGDLEPGRYSLRVVSTNLSRNGIEVEPGQLSQLSLILNTVLPALRVHPAPSLTPPNDDWKWILRTSSAVRPILRYRTGGPDEKTPLEPSEELVAMIPTSEGSSVLSDQVTLGSVLAYWRPLSSDTDVLVANSMAGQGIASWSEMTSFRRQTSDDNAQQVTLVVHQLNLEDGVPEGAQAGGAAPVLAGARGMTLSYIQTRQLSGKLWLTTGFEANDLEAWRSAVTALPRAELDYQLSANDKVAVRYGAIAPSLEDGTLAGQMAEFDTFPRVSVRGFAPRLESVRHSEVSYSRRLGKKTQIEAAAYHDGFTNAVVRGTGSTAAWAEWSRAGDILPNGMDGGMNLNAGSYGATGLRASMAQSFGRHLEAKAAYATGDDLELAPLHPGTGFVASMLRSGRSQSATAKLVAQLPATKTRVVASYDWLPRGSLTAVDPAGLADFDAGPYANLQIRQPVPTGHFLAGAHVEAVAEVRNVARQGYVRVPSSGNSLLLTPAYQTVCGGFSVQF